jgi:hypothetical protein
LKNFESFFCNRCITFASTTMRKRNLPAEASGNDATIDTPKKKSLRGSSNNEEEIVPPSSDKKLSVAEQRQRAKEWAESNFSSTKPTKPVSKPTIPSSPTALKRAGSVEEQRKKAEAWAVSQGLMKAPSTDSYASGMEEGSKSAKKKKRSVSEAEGEEEESEQQPPSSATKSASKRNIRRKTISTPILEEEQEHDDRDTKMEVDNNEEDDDSSDRKSSRRRQSEPAPADSSSSIVTTTPARSSRRNQQNNQNESDTEASISSLTKSASKRGKKLTTTLPSFPKIEEEPSTPEIQQAPTTRTPGRKAKSVRTTEDNGGLSSQTPSRVSSRDESSLPRVTPKKTASTRVNQDTRPRIDEASTINKKDVPNKDENIK